MEPQTQMTKTKTDRMTTAEALDALGKVMGIDGPCTRYRLAKVLGLEPSSVLSWGDGQVPEKHELRLKHHVIKAAKEKTNGITDSGIDAIHEAYLEALNSFEPSK